MSTHSLRRPLGATLVALDLSPASIAVAHRAARLPITRGSPLVLFHVVPGFADSLSRVDADALERAKRELTQRSEQLAREVPGLDVESAVAQGTPYVEIIRRAHDSRAELLVLGRHGHRAFADALVGSTAERVVRASQLPTLVVHGEPRRSYRRVVVGVDMSDGARHATELALRVLDRDPAPVRVVHVDDGRAWNADAEIARFLAPFEAAGLAWEVVHRKGDARAALLAEAAAPDVDLLVLGSHGHSPIVQHLLGHVTEAVVRAASCDVLVARAPRHRPPAVEPI